MLRQAGAKRARNRSNGLKALAVRRRELTGLTWLVLVAGITASILGSLAWRDYARDETNAELGRSSAELSKRLTQDVRRHDQALLSTAGLFAASNSVEESESPPSPPR